MSAIRLLTPPEWVAKYFAPGSEPSEGTVRRWLRSGAVPARKVGGTWYVDEAQWLAGGDDLVARVLLAG